MWFLALQADLTRTWLSAVGAATRTCTDATQAYTEAWTAAVPPSAGHRLQLPFPLAQPRFAVWGTNPFMPFGTLMPWMAAPWFAEWQRQWWATSMWQLPIAQAPMPWAVNWVTPTMASTPVADLMAASYRTATGHAAAAAIILAPLQPKPTTATWFGWPHNAWRGYLN